MSATFWIFLFLALILPVSADPTQPLQKFENCTYVPTDWADGDSFRIKTAAGEEHTIRLYGVDCMEWHVQDDSDARRLRAQRRYFGITGAAPNPQAAIGMAKNFGKDAADQTASLLARPFTIHTRMRDALGDGKYKRIYAFVACADGGDLSATLVKNGLARAFGVDSDTPDGKTIKESASVLADLEMQAAKRGAGIWAKTDWDKLPAERQAQRMDDEEANLAIGKQNLPANVKVDPNKASRDELMKLPGIGEEMADRIIEHRPYTKAEDLLEVSGIGPKSIGKLSPHLIFPKS
ncbi:MAG: helix-hairpin-helix domain-containing protein [Luteolibacter sp.]|jgi:endonuclease YncB( thermonuclease family)|nr:helix-hairpin-helix domain-containing protein [Luteolibacter sp.]